MILKIFIKSYKRIHAGWDRMSTHDILLIMERLGSSFKSLSVMSLSTNHMLRIQSWLLALITVSIQVLILSVKTSHKSAFKDKVDDLPKTRKIGLIDDLCVHRPSTLNDVPRHFTHTCLNFFLRTLFACSCSFNYGARVAQSATDDTDYSTVKQILIWNRLKTSSRINVLHAAWTLEPVTAERPDIDHQEQPESLRHPPGLKMPQI